MSVSQPNLYQPSLYQPTPTLRPVFQRHVPGIGQLAIRPLDVDQDIDLVHAWVSAPRASFWGMQGHSTLQVSGFYRDMQHSAHAQGWLGLCNGQPAFLIEIYDPRHDPLGEHYAVEPGDVGMHFLVAPAETPVSGFSRAVITTIMTFLFESADTRRVVVEPDVNNAAIHPLNQHVGFRYQHQIQLAEKTAWLGMATRNDLANAIASRSPRLSADAQLHMTGSTAHLTPERWAAANRHLVRKAIAEFSHERLLSPVSLSDANADPSASQPYQLHSPDQRVCYRFTARRLALDHWLIDADSLSCQADGQELPIDAQQFINEFRQPLGIQVPMLPVYLEEVSATLFALAYKLDPQRHDADALVDAEFQTLEAAMIEGHPVFVANSGRMGFDAVDFHAYAPEAGSDASLVWLAVHKDCAHFSCSAELDYHQVMEEELGQAQVQDFHARIESHGLKADDYLLMPAHPWQWSHKLAITFAAEVAEQRILCLGHGLDVYRPQQSIRTWYNISQPQRRYVKTALSILNMGFMRGLSPHYMRHTPAINDWVHALVENDPELKAQGFCVLREQAAIGVRRDVIEAHFDKYSGYRKMLSALWRESPARFTTGGHRLTTMAALLHQDHQGHALLPRLIRASGLSAEAWLGRYLRAYLRPLLHCFYAHDLVFMPHGENLILQLKDHVPVRAIMKDIAEEIGLMNTEVELPEEVARIAVEVPEELKVLSLLTDVFDCFLRFVAAILVDDGCIDESRFWQQVAQCIIDYQQDHPQFADQFQRHDLFAPRFTLSCLNRLQLRDHQQMIDLADPAANLQFAGQLDNPIAEFRPQLSQRSSQEPSQQPSQRPSQERPQLEDESVAG